MAWRNNRRRPPGQPNPGSGGWQQVPPRKLELEIYDLRWVSTPDREISFGVRVKEGTVLKLNIPVRFKIDGRDEGVAVATGPDGVSYHKYDGLDPNRDLVAVAAFTVNPAAEVSTVVDFSRQSTGKVAADCGPRPRPKTTGPKPPQKFPPTSFFFCA